MKSILSIQSHVAYGYVGNKAATYPLQAMGFDVWPINTVQFSNHRGYATCHGEVFSAQQITDLVDGIFDIGKASECRAILTGYMGSAAICRAVSDIVTRFKQLNQSILTLCDPVIGKTCAYVAPEVVDFFTHHMQADIITPNHYEAECLSGMTINTANDAHRAAQYFHQRGVGIVVMKGLTFPENDGLNVFASDGQNSYLITTPRYTLPALINGTGDLFSSTFLGSYLTHNDLSLAARYATRSVTEALKASLASGGRELDVLSVSYGDVDSWAGAAV